jgi:hypothetical protein
MVLRCQYFAQGDICRTAGTSHHGATAVEALDRYHSYGGVLSQPRGWKD